MKAFFRTLFSMILGALVLTLLLPRAGAQDRRTRALVASFRGKVVTSNQPLAPAGEEAEFYRYLQKNHRSSISRPPDGPWRIYMVAFFRKPIGATTCHVALYEIKGRKKRFVEAFGQQVQPDQENLAAQVELGTESFKAGSSYELRITRIIKGKERIYASTRLTLN